MSSLVLLPDNLRWKYGTGRDFPTLEFSLTPPFWVKMTEHLGKSLEIESPFLPGPLDPKTNIWECQTFITFTVMKARKVTAA